MKERLLREFQLFNIHRLPEKKKNIHNFAFNTLNQSRMLLYSKFIAITVNFTIKTKGEGENYEGRHLAKMHVASVICGLPGKQCQKCSQLNRNF